MCKKVFLCFLFMIWFIQSHSLSSQSYNYAVYDLHVDKEKLLSFIDNSTISGSNKSLMLKMLGEANRTQMSLSYTDDISIFKIIEQLGIGDYNPRLAQGLLTFLNLENTIYFDHTNAEHYKKRSLGGQGHLVKNNTKPIKWKITSKEKIVNGLVYKNATTNIGREPTVYSVEAWFCPRIPVQHGPGLYHGLPGLIMETYATSETSELDFSFILKKLKYKNIGEISIPLDEFKVYSDEESQALFSGALQKFKN